jgi:hypothetical protein
MRRLRAHAGRNSHECKCRANDGVAGVSEVVDADLSGYYHPPSSTLPP